MSLPATKAHLDFLETAIANEYLYLVQVIEIPVSAVYDQQLARLLRSLLVRS